MIELSLWSSGRLISSPKRTSRTWAGQGGSDSVREKKSKLIFLLHKLTTETIHSLSGFSLSLPNHSFVCHTQFSIFVPQFREQNVGEVSCHTAIAQEPD